MYDFDKPEWAEAKEKLGLKDTNLPYLNDGDVALSEISEIMKHIASKYKPDLLGQIEIEKAEVGINELKINKLQ
jgi:hypothetical protein